MGLVKFTLHAPIGIRDIERNCTGYDVDSTIIDILKHIRTCHRELQQMSVAQILRPLHFMTATEETRLLNAIADPIANILFANLQHRMSTAEKKYYGVDHRKKLQHTANSLGYASDTIDTVYARIRQVLCILLTNRPKPYAALSKADIHAHEVERNMLTIAKIQPITLVPQTEPERLILNGTHDIADDMWHTTDDAGAANLHRIPISQYLECKDKAVSAIQRFIQMHKNTGLTLNDFIHFYSGQTPIAQTALRSYRELAKLQAVTSVTPIVRQNKPRVWDALEIQAYKLSIEMHDQIGVPEYIEHLLNIELDTPVVTQDIDIE
jgi:hypothetical protein